MPNTSIFAERAVLGICLTNRDYLLDAISVLTEDDFSAEENRIIYRAMNDCFAAHEPTDYNYILQKLSSDGNLQKAGGADYIKELVIDDSNPSSYSDFVRILKEHTTLRKLRAACADITKKIDEGGIQDIPEFVNASRAQVNEMAENQQIGGLRTVSQILDSVMNKFEEENADRDKPGYNPYVTGYSTGYSLLDRKTTGFHKSELVIIGARPSVGKTALAINFALNIARSGVPVAFFSLEMTNVSIVTRMLCNRSGMSQEEIRSLNLRASKDLAGNRIYELPERDRKDPNKVKDAQRVMKAMAELKNLPIYIDEKPGTTVVSLESEVRKLQASVPTLGVVIIDYLTLIHSAGNKTSSQDSRATVVGDISRALKAMARNLSVSVVCLSQLRRIESGVKVENHMPALSDLRDSGAIEQDADQVLFIYRPDYYGLDSEGKRDDSGQNPVNNDTSITTIKVAKNRNGPLGSVKFSFNKPACTFFELAEDLEDD